MIIKIKSLKRPIKRPQLSNCVKIIDINYIFSLMETDKT